MQLLRQALSKVETFKNIEKGNRIDSHNTERRQGKGQHINRYFIEIKG